MITKKQGKFGEMTQYVYYLDCGDVFMGVFQVKNHTCAVYLLIKPQKSCKYYFYTSTSQIYQLK